MTAKMVTKRNIDYRHIFQNTSSTQETRTRKSNKLRPQQQQKESLEATLKEKRIRLRGLSLGALKGTRP